MIKPTDEMAIAANRVHKAGKSWNEIVAAVLAIVERDQAGPCSATLPRLTEFGDLWCQLRHGHLGDHEMGPTRWKEQPTPRCEARGFAIGPGCIRRAGHEGGHGYGDGSGEQDEP